MRISLDSVAALTALERVQGARAKMPSGIASSPGLQVTCGMDAQFIAVPAERAVELTGIAEPLLMILFLPHKGEADPEKIGREYRLSVVAVSLISMLLDGQVPKKIAQQRGVSVATVRAQLSAVFSKTGCRTQKELIMRLGLGCPL